MKKAGITDATFTTNLGHAMLRTVAANVATGTMKPKDAAAAISDFWKKLCLENDARVFSTRSALSGKAMQNIRATLKDAFPDNRQAGNSDAALASFLGTGTIKNDVDVVTNETKIVTAEEFRSRFDALVTNPRRR